MKKAFLIFLVFSIGLLASCGSPESQTAQPTKTQVPVKQPTHTPMPTSTSKPICPEYASPEKILTLSVGTANTEPWLLAGDFNSDGLDDVMVTWGEFNSETPYPITILLNNGVGGLIQGTDRVFSGEIPSVPSLPANPLVVTDFNGDGTNDLFLLVSSKDQDPFPGAQNLLFLSGEENGLANATANLPALSDFPHSVTTGDVDQDGDVDIFVGNIWAGQMIPPQMLLNDGIGRFSQANYLLPPLLSLQQNGYTASELIDVNMDSYPDLVLADAGDDISNPYSTPDSHVLLNDGTGRFTPLENAIPPKGAATWIGLDIVAVELNGDTYPDLIITYTDQYRGHFFQVLINNQDGTFTEETAKRMPGANDPNNGYVYGLDLLDYDHDGDQDLIARYWSDSQNAPFVFINSGAGYFKKQIVDIDLGWLYYTIVDVDGDNGHDFVLASFGANTEIFLIRETGCN